MLPWCVFGSRGRTRVHLGLLFSIEGAAANSCRGTRTVASPGDHLQNPSSLLLASKDLYQLLPVSPDAAQLRKGE
jgi:hypothetical protein